MTQPSLTERKAEILLKENRAERNRSLVMLQETKPVEAWDALIPLLTASDEK